MKYQKRTDQKQLRGLILQHMKYNLSWDVSDRGGIGRSLKRIKIEELWGGEMIKITNALEK